MKWLKPVDLRGVDLDIVDISRTGISLYDELNNNVKPPAGEKLNGPVHVTIYHLFPKTANKKESFVEKLKNHSGDEFLGYESDGGTWTFRINHF